METYGTTVAGRPERTPTEWEQRVLDAVQEKAANGLIECYLGPDMPLVLIHARSIGSVAEALSDTGAGEGFPFLLDVTSVDYSASDEETPARFAVVWHFLDPSRGRRVRVKAYVSEEGEVPSLAGRFASADWAEREVFDMMGIRFSGHPDLKRILMPESYEGHPQRKDFPTQGPERGKRIHGEILGNKPLTSWKELHEI